MVVCLFVGVAAADGWTGLWRVQRSFQGKTEGTYHIQISDAEADRVTVYDHEARPMFLQTVVFDGDQLELGVANSAIQPLPLLFKLNRIGERVTGEWLFAQFQLADPLQGGAAGFRVFADAQWDPWAGVEKHRGDRVIDLLGLLRKEAPLNQLGKFQAYWAENIEKPYYFLIESWFYGAATGPEPVRRDKLRALFLLLSKPSPERDLVDQFPKWAGQAVGWATDARAIGFQGFLVSFPGPEIRAQARLWTRTPTAEEEASCACKIDLREEFLLFNPAGFATQEEGSLRLVKSLARETAWPGFSPSVAIEVYRQTLALEKALEILGRPLPVADPAMAGVLRGMFRDRLLTGEPVSSSPEEILLAESLSVVLGFDFIGWMRARHAEKPLPSLDNRDVMEGWFEYLSGTQGRIQRERRSKS